MTVVKSQRPLQLIKLTDPAKPLNPPLKPKFVESIPKAGRTSRVYTGEYVDALKRQDHPHGSKSSLTTATSSISAMRSGEWLNPQNPAPNYRPYA